MQQVILRKLQTYRSRIRTAVTVEGVSNLVLILVGLVLLSVGIDYWQRLGLFPRIFSLAVGLAILAYVVYRRLIVRLGCPMGDERVALTVEDRFPELRDRVISSLQFMQAAESGAFGRSEQSRPMMDAVTREAVAAFEPLDLARTIDTPRLVRAVCAAVLGVGILVFLSTVSVEGVNVMGLWFKRNILLMDVSWPQRTHLVVDYKRVIPKGDALVIDVKATGREIPSTVTIRYRYRESGRRGEEDLPLVVGGKDPNVWRARFKNVVEPLEFRLYGGDAAAGPFQVDLVERPTILQLRFYAVYPYYTRLLPKLLARKDQGFLDFLEVLPGTMIRVAVVPSKPLKAGSLNPNDEEKGGVMTRADTDAKTRDFWFTAEDQAKNHKEGQDEFWVGEIKATEDCTVAVNVTDTMDLVSRPPARFTIKIIADKEPAVIVRMKGIGEMITPKATIPLDIRVADDFGIRSLALRHKFIIEDKSADEELLPFPALVYGGKELTHEYRWTLDPLGLQPGSVFVFRAEATDYKDIEPKNVGRSENISLRVVTPDELIADLVRRQNEQRQEFVRIHDRERDEIQIEIDAAGRIAQAKAALSDSEKERFLAAEQTVRQSTEELKHVASMFDQVLQEMVNNKVGEEDEKTRLKTGIVEPIRRIAETMIPELADGMQKAAAAAGDALKKQMPLLVDRNGLILQEMDKIKTNMLKMEGFREIVATVKKMREDEFGLLGEIEKEHRRIIESILGLPPEKKP